MPRMSRRIGATIVVIFLATCAVLLFNKSSEEFKPEDRQGAQASSSGKPKNEVALTSSDIWGLAKQAQLEGGLRQLAGKTFTPDDITRMVEVDSAWCKGQESSPATARMEEMGQDVAKQFEALMPAMGHLANSWDKILRDIGGDKFVAAADVISIVAKNDFYATGSKELRKTALLSSEPAVISWALRYACQSNEGDCQKISERWRLVDPSNIDAWLSVRDSRANINGYLISNAPIITAAKFSDSYEADLLSIILALPRASETGVYSAAGSMLGTKIFDEEHVSPSRQLASTCHNADGNLSPICSEIAMKIWPRDENLHVVRQELSESMIPKLILKSEEWSARRANSSKSKLQLESIVENPADLMNCGRQRAVIRQLEDRIVPNRISRRLEIQ